MENNKSTEYKTVRGLARGLMLLNMLNRLNGGANVGLLAELSGLHYIMARRLLETLQSEDYVRCNPPGDSLRLTVKVRQLSEGFHDKQWISAFATPLLGDPLHEVIWPTGVSTLDVGAMAVHETTHRFSRLSLHRTMIRRRLPLPRTAPGLTWPAFCLENGRRELTGIPASRSGEEPQLTCEPLRLNAILTRARKNGFGQNFRGWDQEEEIASIAIPICREQQAVGCLNLAYMAGTMTIERAAEEYLLALQKVAKQIKDGVESQGILTARRRNRSRLCGSSD